MPDAQRAETPGRVSDESASSYPPRSREQRHALDRPAIARSVAVCCAARVGRVIQDGHLLAADGRGAKQAQEARGVRRITGRIGEVLDSSTIISLNAHKSVLIFFTKAHPLTKIP